MSETMVGVLGIVVFLVLVFLRMPIGLAMLLCGIVGYWYVDGFTNMANILSKIPYRITTTYILTCLPPFILMGEIAALSGLSGEAYGLARKWVGHLKGGLAMATLGGVAMFSAVVGSGITCAVTMVGVSLPEMQKAGYDDQLSIGTIATGTILGPMIPPSTVFILYCYLTQASLGDLLIGGIMPGIMLAVLYMMTVAIWVKIKPKIATAGPRSSWRERITGFPAVWGIIVVFAFMLWGIYTGFFTPTEGGALGALAVFVLAVARRRLSWRNFGQALLSAGRITGLVTIIIVGTQVFNGFLAITRVPFELADLIMGLPSPSVVIMGIILLVYIICGFFIDVFALIFITVPIFYPIVLQMGFDPVWFGVMICLVAGLGGISPPYGLIIFALRTFVPEIPMWTMFRGCLPFVCTNLVAIVLLLIFPQIAYWLPYLGKVT